MGVIWSLVVICELQIANLCEVHRAGKMVALKFALRRRAVWERSDPIMSAIFVTQWTLQRGFFKNQLLIDHATRFRIALQTRTRSISAQRAGYG
jgi:hypothetical protein